jgi:trimethylamine:corrinoid methyltransferase-like protein
MLSPKAKRGFTAFVLFTLALVSVVVVDQDLKYIKQAFDLRGRNHQQMSINLGGGNCQWTAPMISAPTGVDFHKTMIVGSPSG